MGLDNFWIRDPTDKQVVDLPFDPPLHLVGGMFSGHGAGSFRGKVYAAIVEEATGVSLYQGFIPNETVQAMATSLRTWFDALPSDESRGVRDTDASRLWHVPRAQLSDLVRMFEGYAAEGCGLAGWW